jgi:hypothetical protein
VTLTTLEHRGAGDSLVTLAAWAVEIPVQSPTVSGGDGAGSAARTFVPMSAGAASGPVSGGGPPDQDRIWRSISS